MGWGQSYSFVVDRPQYRRTMVNYYKTIGLPPARLAFAFASATGSGTLHALAMRKLFLPVLGLLCAVTTAYGEIVSEKRPLEITATGSTNYQDGLATAHGDVAIHTGDCDIYADSAQYNPKTREVAAEGHVRIYRAA